MRRLLIILSAACLLLLTAAAPVFAAPPVREEGTFVFAGAFVSECEQVGGSTVCTDTNLFIDDFGEAFVCVDRFTYAQSPGGRFRLISQESGCTPLAEGAYTVNESTLQLTLSPTDVELFSCSARRCTPSGTVTVSATFDPVGEIGTQTVRGTFRQGDCTVRFTDVTSFTDAQATITIVDGSETDTLSASGFVQVTETTFTARNCE